MSVRFTTGVGGLARVLARLVDGTPRSVAELARTERLSRSSAFDLVRRLQAAELVERDPAGKLIAGPRLIALAFGRFGLARLRGPAEALLAWLRDHGDAATSLTCADGEERVKLLSFAADWARPAVKDRPATLTYPIFAENGREAARLELICRHNCSRAERAEIESLALRVKASLEHYLREEAAA
jgi:hypothetical protein